MGLVFVVEGSGLNAWVQGVPCSPRPELTFFIFRFREDSCFLRVREDFGCSWRVEEGFIDGSGCRVMIRVSGFRVYSVARAWGLRFGSVLKI